MGQSWSDILYPDNPHRRDRVAELANKLRSNVEQVYTVFVTMSLVVNRTHPEYEVVPPIDLRKTYNVNFEVLKATFAQWAKISEQQKNGEEVTAETRKLIDDINSATDAKAFSDHVDKVIAKVSDAAFWTGVTVGLVVGTLASKAGYILVVSAMAEGWLGSALGVVGGVVAGAAVGVVVEMIIAAIDGARERSELEARAAELQEAIDKLHPEVTNLQKEVAGITMTIMSLQTKINTV